MIHLIMKSYKNYPNSFCGNSGFMPHKTEHPSEATCKRCITAYENNTTEQQYKFTKKISKGKN